MTSAQLFTRLTRPLNGKDPTAFSDEDKQYLVDAANLGLNQFTRALPSLRLQEPRSERLGLSETHGADVVKGSAGITWNPAWTQAGSYLGRSCVVAGDTNGYNRLQTTTSLQNTYEGATGTTTIEVLSDAVMIGQSFELAGDVIIMDGASTFALTYGMPNSVYPGRWRNAFGVLGGDAEAAQRTIIRARPTNWWVETLNGITGNADPMFLLRLWPQPDKVYHINFNLRLWPTALKASDIGGTYVLPIQPNEEASFLNLCYPALFTCTRWLGTANKDDYQTAADRTLSALLGDERNRGHQQFSIIKTKAGY